MPTEETSRKEVYSSRTRGIRELLVLLVLLDVLGAALAVSGAYWIRAISSDHLPVNIIFPVYPFVIHIRIFLFAIPLQIFLFRGVGLYDRHNLFFGSHEYVLVVKACTYYILSLVIISFVLLNFYPSKLLLLISGILMLTLIGTFRFVVRRYLWLIRKKRGPLERVLIIGVSEESGAIAERLEKGGMGEVVGFLDDFLPQGTEVWQEKQVLDVPSNYAKLAKKSDVTLVIALLDAIGWESRKKVLEMAFTEQEIDFQIAPGIGDMSLMAMKISFKGHLPLLRFRLGYLRGMASLLKRGMDFLIGLILLVLLGPIILLFSAVLLTCGVWPVISRIKVLGKNGKPFNAYKFNTGVTNRHIRRRLLAKDWRGAMQSMGLFCRFLFRTGLDKLPQVFNLLMGNMSLVGPRTVLKENSSDYNELLPGVLSVRPGITGPWIFLEEGGLEEEVLHTTFYIRYWSFWEDIVILIRTVILGFRYMFRTGYDDERIEND